MSNADFRLLAASAPALQPDAQWHDRSYEAESSCDGCRKIFEGLRQMDREAIQALGRELAVRVRLNKLPLDLRD